MVSLGALDGVFSRLDSYLPDFPKYLRDSFTLAVEHVLALRTRSGSVIRLREHFRSMPEIIAWSSGQFYADAPLVPVRQFVRTGRRRCAQPSSRWRRHRTELVVDEPRRGTGPRRHARAVPDDEAYDGKTFGVVVLQGQSQVDVIQNELLDRLTPEQWEERRLRVGTPPDFQGDERHVVFVDGRRARTEHRGDDEDRIPAAVQCRRNSSAGPQLWLFHSRTVDTLRATDLRHSLLTYMQSTLAMPAAPMPDGVTRDERHAAFGSLFEQDVFLDIASRGYHGEPAGRGERPLHRPGGDRRGGQVGGRVRRRSSAGR